LVTEKTRIDLVVDGKKFTTEGKEVELRINGMPVYDLEITDLPWKHGKKSPEDYEALNLSFLIRVMKAMFGHPDRYKIVVSLRDSPKSFTVIQKSLNFKPATLDFHLKKLSNEMIVEKMGNQKRYSLTIIGEAMLDYFSDLLQKVKSLHE
jgi:DNA-binding HxlR family transcriptional regulator